MTEAERLPTPSSASAFESPTPSRRGLPPDSPAHLLDTNNLVRIVKRDDAERPLIIGAIQRLAQSGADLCYVPQNIVELWNVLTRPLANNGCGMKVSDAKREIALLEREFTFLPDNEKVHTEWRRLVETHSVSGKQVHDARLVAAMVVHGVTHLLTLNTADFKRYSEITAVHPRTLVEAR
jgi:predicted nucleic acid-binding protein